MDSFCLHADVYFKGKCIHCHFDACQTLNLKFGTIYGGAPALPRILSPRDFLAKKKIAPNLNNTEKQKLEMPRT